MVIPLILFLAGITVTLVSLALLHGYLPTNRNFAGHAMATSAGLILIPIILSTVAAGSIGVLTIGKEGYAYLIYSLFAGVVGFVDDAWGGEEARGFRGHLGEMARGRLTTGVVKILALGGGALIVAGVVHGVGWKTLIGAFLLAGSVNLANLLDVRPGRTIKFLALPILVLIFLAPGSWVVLPVVGGVLALFYFDLRERIMLGDAGAAVHGAVLGYLVLASGPGLVWWFAGVVILGLTVVAEVSSISRLIEEVTVLRRLDLWGRGNGE